MSTFLHVISFPFWFLGFVLLGAALANTITINFGSGYKRKATTVERICSAATALVFLTIAYFLTIQ